MGDVVRMTVRRSSSRPPTLEGVASVVIAAARRTKECARDDAAEAQVDVSAARPIDPNKVRPADRPIFVSSRRSSIAHLLARDTMAASTRVVLGVFALAALVTYNLLSMMHGHATASALGHHMDSHPLNLNNRDDAFSFEPHVVAEAGARISAPPRPPPSIETWTRPLFPRAIPG